jgi:pimeloyl-ACP methyl ester carboxylesterase
MKVETVRSADGTTIAFETAGEGPPLILVGGAFCDRSARASGTPLAALLAHRYAVISYDRRGRGDSTDSASWSIDRELTDLSALIELAGGRAFVFGNSSGGLLALAAAVRGMSISQLVLFEPPVILDANRATSFFALAQQLDAEARAERRSEAVALYFTSVMQMPEPAVAQMRNAPIWSELERLAHTLSYDLRITASVAAKLEQLASVRSSTLVMAGSQCPAWLREAIETLTCAIPHARYRTLERQTHAVDPEALATAIAAHLAG